MNSYCCCLYGYDSNIDRNNKFIPRNPNNIPYSVVSVSNRDGNEIGAYVIENGDIINATTLMWLFATTNNTRRLYTFDSAWTDFKSSLMPDDIIKAFGDILEVSSETTVFNVNLHIKTVYLLNLDCPRVVDKESIEALNDSRISYIKEGLLALEYNDIDDIRHTLKKIKLIFSTVTVTRVFLNPELIV